MREFNKKLQPCTPLVITDNGSIIANVGNDNSSQNCDETEATLGNEQTDLNEMVRSNHEDLSIALNFKFK